MTPEPSSAERTRAGRLVFRRLVESLTYEGAIRPELRPAGENRFECHLAGRQTDGTPVVYHWAAERRFSFGRLRLRGDAVTRSAGGVAGEAVSPRLFLAEVAAGLTAEPERREQFAGELEHTVRNDAQGRAHWRSRGRDPAGAAFDELESLVVEGHPYHPSYKSRLGFDGADNAAFGPEFAAPIRPVWAALHRDVARTAAVPGTDPDAFLAGDLGTGTVEAYRAALVAAGHRPEHYRLVPVHPWQWREQIPAHLFPLIADGALVPVGIAPDVYRAQQSIRTLANATRPAAPSLKLSLGIVNTSTARNLAPHTAVNAPAVTTWLRGFVAGDPYLAEEHRPVLLGEVLATAYDPGQSPAAAGPPAGLLSAIWRESVHPYLEPGEAAVPFTALTHVDPDDAPFLTGWLKEHGVEEWAHRLLDVAVPPVLRFLLGHGVALEAHAQNLILLHRGGVPARLVLRDFHDGLRFCPSLLADPAGRPALEATPAAHLRLNRNSYLEAETADEVRDFAHDCLFFVNLAELAMFLDDHFGLPERRFWALARAVVDGYHRRFPAATPFDVLAPSVRVEQLASRRLLPDTSVRTHEVPNPLHEVGSAEVERARGGTCSR